MPAAQQAVSLQGIVIPASSVNPQAFFAATRRQNLLMRTIPAIAGPGSTDIVPILQTGIMSHLNVRVSGTVTVAVGTGTVATTAQWPYNVARAVRFTANGQSNLINASGWGLKLMELAKRSPLDDRGVPQYVTGAYPGTQVQQGTLSLSSEQWGLGSQVTAIPNGTYNVNLTIPVPVAYDDVTLLGAIFAQTQSTDLELAIDWNPLANLFVTTGTATVTLALSAIVEGTVYTIPSVGGGIAVPNLSAFHSLVESRAPNSISTGTNEITLAGQGVGRTLMRLAFRCFNGATPVPLSMNAANFTQPYWRFGGNTTPEQFSDGAALRTWDELIYDSDVGGQQGYGVFDFSSIWAQRDSIDEGAATQLRFGFTIPNSVSLTSPYVEYVQQAIVAGAATS